jgi:hypothetical protein
VLTIAKKLKVEWHTAKSYIDRFPETKQAYENEREKILDMADAGLYKAVKDGDLAAIKWLQSTQGKKRGYVEKVQTELTGEDGKPIAVATTHRVVFENFKGKKKA